MITILSVDEIHDNVETFYMIFIFNSLEFYERVFKIANIYVFELITFYYIIMRD